MRDGGEHLPEAIGSLEAQTDPDFEVVAVDDGSGDATPDLLAEWAGRDGRVRILRQEPSGIVAALERARLEASAPLLVRMDADDVAEPRRLELQRRLMDQRDDVVLCGCRVRYFPRDTVRDGALRYEAWLNGPVDHDEIVRELFVECPLAHPTFCMRAEAVEAVGGYRDAGWPEDYDLLLRLWRAGGRLGKVPETLLRWREGPERLSRVHPRYHPEAFRRCKTHFLTDTLLAARDGAVVWGAGPVGKAFARELDARGERVKAFAEVDPRKIGQEIHGAPVVDTEGGLAYVDALHLAAVGQQGARETLRGVLAGAGFTEMEDFVAVA